MLRLRYRHREPVVLPTHHGLPVARWCWAPLSTALAATQSSGARTAPAWAGPDLRASHGQTPVGLGPRAGEGSAPLPLLRPTLRAARHAPLPPRPPSPPCKASSPQLFRSSAGARTRPSRSGISSGGPSLHSGLGGRLVISCQRGIRLVGSNRNIHDQDILHHEHRELDPETTRDNQHCA